MAPYELFLRREAYDFLASESSGSTLHTTQFPSSHPGGDAWRCVNRVRRAGGGDWTMGVLYDCVRLELEE